jgi:hypothetical protein
MDPVADWTQSAPAAIMNDGAGGVSDDLPSRYRFMFRRPGSESHDG